MSDRFVSVIIPTFNRAESLIRCVNSLASQDYPADRFEVIVVDDGSDPSEVERMSHHIDSISSIDVRLLTQEENTGPAAARNRGIQSARGDVIGFVDDDCICDKGWISSGVSRLTKHPDLAGVEGMTVAIDDGKPSVFAHRVQNTTGRRFLTCNLFVGKAWLQKVGGFDARFYCRGLAPVREDSDLAFSILEAGGDFEFAPEALVRHPTRPSSWKAHWRTAHHGFFESLIRMKHPRLFSRPHEYGLTRRRVEYAIPPYYYGHYIAALLFVLSLLGSVLSLWIPVTVYTLSVLAIAAKHQLGRRFALSDFARLCAIYSVIPFLRLYYLARGYYVFAIRGDSK